MPAAQPANPRVFRFIVMASLGVAAFFMLATTHADPDLWGHLRFGSDILQHMRLDSADPYSFTSDRPWINHEWLSEVAIAATWMHAGSSGLIALKLAIVAATMWLVIHTLAVRGVGRGARLLLGGLALVGILPRTLYVRPQLFSLLLFAALVHVLTHAEGGRRRWLALCPVILALWVNFHGGWIAGLGSLVVWALADAWSRRGKGVRALDALAWTGVSTAATLLNPYGTGLWDFLLETVRPGREAIGEWGPAWNEPAVLIVWLLLGWLGAASAARKGSSRDVRRYVLPVLWCAASLMVVRLDAFFALSVVGFLGSEIEAFLGRTREHRSLPVVARAAIVATVLCLAVSFPAARSALTCVPVQADEWPEPDSVEFIHLNDLSGRMLTYFNWGQYAIWHVPPAVKVSMDGRRETVYSDAMISGHLRFYAAKEEGVSFAEGLRADYVWLPVGSPAAAALKGRGWSTAFEGERSMILLSPDRTPEEPFVQPASGGPAATRCFPGP